MKSLPKPSSRRQQALRRNRGSVARNLQRFMPALELLEDRRLLNGSGPDVDVLKSADQSTITAGQTAGFTVKITNDGDATATGVTLNDSLPAGLGNDINWQIDTST